MGKVEVKRLWLYRPGSPGSALRSRIAHGHLNAGGGLLVKGWFATG